MDSLHFYKYHGAGNDFVMFDNRESIFPSENTDFIAWLCDRRFGVGGDGIILLNQHSTYDFEMVYHNADGSVAMCGNGARCAVHLANYLGVIGAETSFLAHDGAHTATIEAEQVTVNLSDVSEVDDYEDGFFLNTGTRHFVRVLPENQLLSGYDVITEGRKLRYDDRFMPEGTNASFVQTINGQVQMRIYERGVENETLSSGTGITAVALALAHANNLVSPIRVQAKGGQLTIAFKREENQGFSHVFMTGPAVMVFEGTVFV
ncbi:diaminopimelate epimerase [Tunicatimonas pelagia]|uniref:diaminopimelate epimerase n=1 Tax=Tunicatimonas pelagia TaxID=931531 RepID=UPI0026655FFE|nr:diaminopimelate epimerase [Tunicatimonas pelagia]WKN44580.1 diaminopimelate epimerase [Tunicatimonas pelagia]